MTTDARGRIRVRLRSGSANHPDDYGWATSAPGNAIERAGGYTVEWDEGEEDHPDTRWFFDSDDMFELEYA